MHQQTTLLHHARLATMASHAPYGLIDNGAILISGQNIIWAGPMDKAPEAAQTADTKIDCQGGLITPGLIDCHTHIVYGGNRAKEFELRLEGAGYEEIARNGGGIVSTVAATRAASLEQLTNSALNRLDRLLAEGVTTIEVKSGYGLDVATEINMLKAARQLASQRPVSVVTSYLGAHAMPPNEELGRKDYLDLVCNDAMPKIAAAGLADAVDGFCEGIAFSVLEIDRVFKKAAQLKLPVKLHAEQLSNLGGAAMAASHGALSVDHIEYLDEAGVAAIAKSGTVAVLLPGAFYYLRESQSPPVTALRQHNVPIAIATDLNPGSSPVHSLLTTMNMACVLFRLTPEEALRGVTINAARALGLSDRGLIAKDHRADLALWKVESPGELSYPLGYNPCQAVWQSGHLSFGSA